MHGRDERTQSPRQAGAPAPRPKAGPAPRPAVGGLSPTQVLALQRTVGNATVTALLRSSAAPAVQQGSVRQGSIQRPSVQRETEDAEVTVGRVKDTLDTTAQSVGATTAVTIGSQFTDPSVSTSASYAGGMTGPFGSGIAAGAGLAAGITSLHAAQHERDAHPAGTAPHREASRELSGARAEVGQNTSALVGNLLNGAGGAMNFAGQAPPVYNAVFSAGGAAALPASLVQTGRYARKAAKAGARAEALRQLMASQATEPGQALAAAEQDVAAHRELVGALGELLTAKRAIYDARLQEMGRSPMDRPLGTDLDTLKQARLEVHEWEQRAVAADRGLAEALAEQGRREQARDAMERALGEAAQEVGRHREGAPDQVSLRMIQAYAVRKNQRGRIKKVIAAAGGALGSAGSVAALVTSVAVAAGATAGAGVLLATPVGWALAAAAAVTGLGLAAYKLWKYFAKRWQRAAEPGDDGRPTRSGRQRLGDTLAFWRKAGPGKREEYASALYRMAKGGQDADRLRTEEARRTVTALGLDWDALRMGEEPESATKLIAAKLAS